MSMNISIVIPTHNRARLLDITLGSLTELKVPAGMRVEILVVDNNCTDNTAGIVSSHARRSPVPVRRILETRQGLSHSRNCGVEAAEHDFIAFFDDDVRAAPEWLAGCAEAFDRLNADCVVGPVHPAFECATPRHVTPSIVRQICSPYSLKGDELIVLPADVSHEVPGCNFAVRRQVARDVGGFNPELGRRAGESRSGEDFEFGMRLVRAGKRVVYQPRCSIEHFITAEKLGKPWLRMRWYGDGLSHRLSNPEPGFLHSVAGRARAVAGIVRLEILSLFWWLAGKHARSFEYELNARRALGYLRGK